MVVVVAGQQALAADHYTLPQGIDIGRFDSALRLESAVRRVHAPGDLITIDSRHDLFDVMVEAKVLVVKFVSTAHHPLQWAFHRDTGQALQAIAADPVDSELVSMSRTLGAMMNRAAVPALSHLCDHQQYFVRWAAMQALGYVAPELLVPRLKVAEEDPHPHIRAAAHKALNRILPQG
ncbi:HEAT repeat domain-containing protein [Xanthomonas oryzae]|nr:HEAT repeat domain-containing protein [Xanthomonas oryzae]MDI9071131.1 HEAT repeat domain-containing protein [Xanthomonas oryzae pv. oryzae]MDI9079261.1 HEAT repeat domain-containing protein [Xanthomonas oryzae pv. oryzae]MDI9102013.1 HEAT repeat domain-containing protein [Xanthomonas oryzae pv. oryzae]MDI9910740.1 HEAT repeat domain-containing protein [Xanthomonas oryzae pv. oryzae]UUF79180.1 HEAT repeat domain-containing protein [Xanthomonas oryzae pv. oryzae]